MKNKNKKKIQVVDEKGTKEGVKGSGKSGESFGKTTGKVWRSFDELAGDPQFREQNLHREFPENASEVPEGVSRRDFLKTMGAGLALAGAAGLSSCSMVRKPEQIILPYANMPEHVVPGKPLFFATAMGLGEDVVGLLAETHEGRPTKIEGNPLHSESLGKTSHLHQAALLDLFDPDRENPKFAAQKAVAAQLGKWKQELKTTAGDGFGIVHGNTPSPTFHRLLSELKKQYPSLNTYRIDAVNNDNAYKGVEAISGVAALPQVNYKQADVVVSLGCDFLSKEDSSVRVAADVAGRRDPDADNPSRIYVYEDSFTITGTHADHRFIVRRSGMHLLAYALIAELYNQGVRLIDRNFIALVEGMRAEISALLADTSAQVSISHVVRDLLANAGKAVVVAGRDLPPEVHSLVFYINNLLRSPVRYQRSAFHVEKQEFETSLQAASRLSSDLSAKRVDRLLVLDTDLLEVVPADMAKEFVSNFEKAQTLVLTGLVSATAEKSNTIVRKAHFLEQWGDLVSHTGDLTISQPTILAMQEGTYSAIALLGSLYDTALKGLDEVFLKEIATLSKVESARAGKHSLERALIRATHALSFKQWKEVLHNGVQPKWWSGAVALDVAFLGRFISSLSTGKTMVDGLELVFMQDYSLYDGRFANNAWLQELPDPITKLTWDNAILISKRTADKLGVKNYDKVRISTSDEGAVAQGAIWVLPGQADDVLGVSIGYGQNSGKISAGSGFSIASLRTSDGYYLKKGISIEKLEGESYPLASVQDHWAVEDELFEGKDSSNSQNGRPLYRKGTLDEYKNSNPNFAEDMVEVPSLPGHLEKSKALNAPVQDAEEMSVFKEHQYSGEYQWGMTIDLSRCNGCNACVVACQAENNIPVVGKEMVLRGREMHWIRLDRYFEGDPYDPKVVHQPVNCMQCEQAPCEQVCPVAATVHSSEGLNDMVYNRCIGTRYCSNNCPYKVRRFNFFDYHADGKHAKRRVSSHIFDLFKEPADSLQQQFNPDVSVRMRGVMEKCTYCVQRINEARVPARNEKRKIADGEIQTACQQVCPASAIEFGDVADSTSRVSKNKRLSRDYALLAELNVQPRTTYLAAVVNPNEQLLRALGKKS